MINENVSLQGFDDFHLFRKLYLLEAPNLIKVHGRKGINAQINGFYQKQTTLHCSRVWYKKVETIAKEDVTGNVQKSTSQANTGHKNEWVIRYHSQSEQWLFDKRGLRTDDVANALGKGGVMTPLEIKHWQVHDGSIFAWDRHIILTPVLQC
ncbi:hypothetical protein RFI_13884 [Reticulomyxa filosa]|uniref:Uncharacterized protein n=1 Tax=Reticulomyxa filosa TaxID=46433 RepID=X6NBM3_RETFI|nr:hypothetical protein RFI_13884 [Reticulomyxa filosa]|eukprot:ETO23298.1 hypothetical protein RFI_13884 [Reticulomyxa filosa]